jgi:hypothetical protein
MWSSNSHALAEPASEASGTSILIVIASASAVLNGSRDALHQAKQVSSELECCESIPAYNHMVLKENLSIML